MFIGLTFTHILGSLVQKKSKSREDIFQLHTFLDTLEEA